MQGKCIQKLSLLCEALYDIANEPIHLSSQHYLRTSLSKRMEIQLKYSNQGWIFTKVGKKFSLFFSRKSRLKDAILFNLPTTELLILAFETN